MASRAEPVVEQARGQPGGECAGVLTLEPSESRSPGCHGYLPWFLLFLLLQGWVPSGPPRPRLPWLPALALRGSALTAPGARCRFTPKASDARSRLLQLIARISGFRERTLKTASSDAE